MIWYMIMQIIEMSVDSSTDGRQIKKLQIFHICFGGFFLGWNSRIYLKSVYIRGASLGAFFFVITCFILTKLWSMMVIILICYRMQYLVYHSDETNVHLLSPYMIKFKFICDSMTLFSLFCSILHCLKYLFLIFYFLFIFTEPDMHVFDILIIWLFLFEKSPNRFQSQSWNF